MLSRALGTAVADARSEPLGQREGTDVERLRFTTDGSERTLLFERLAPRHALEAQLLPFLARATDRVPATHARGAPRIEGAVPWVLVEDLGDAATACDADPLAIVDAKIAVERAVANDLPALRALGVPERTPRDLAEAIAVAAGNDIVAAEARECARRIAKWPVTLVHGDLRCANAVVTDRGVVLRRWGSAYLGCALLDLVRLVGDLVGRDDAVRGIGLGRTYAERLDIVLATEVLRGAEKLERMVRRYLDPAAVRPKVSP